MTTKTKLTKAMWTHMRDPVPLLQVVAYSGGQFRGYHAGVVDLPEGIDLREFLEQIIIGMPPAEMTLRAIVEDGSPWLGAVEHVTHAAVWTTSDLDEPPAEVAQVQYNNATGHYEVVRWYE